MTVISILEADMPPDKAAKLEANFNEGTKELEPGVVQMFLVRNGTKCKILIVWENKEAVNASKSRGPPKAAQMFKYAGVEPIGLVYDVVKHVEK